MQILALLKKMTNPGLNFVLFYFIYSPELPELFDWV